MDKTEHVEAAEYGSDIKLTSPRSYAAIQSDLSSKIIEFKHLFLSHRKNIKKRVSSIINEIDQVERRMNKLGFPSLSDLDMLDIGPGQQLGHFLVLATKNRATAIDLDIIPRAWRVNDYVELLRQNGLTRLLKTVARKLMRVDSKLHNEILKRCNLDTQPEFRIMHMDATAMEFEDSSFDFVFSRSVFEHISDPESALREVNRVIKRGGGFHITVHLYTSDSGCHDPRIFSGRRQHLPPWPHLHESSRKHVRPNSFLNKIRLGEWEALFLRWFPGVELERVKETNPFVLNQLPIIRQEGKLKDYSDDELMTVALHAFWVSRT